MVKVIIKVIVYSRSIYTDGTTSDTIAQYMKRFCLFWVDFTFFVKPK